MDILQKMKNFVLSLIPIYSLFYIIKIFKKNEVAQGPLSYNETEKKKEYDIYMAL